MTRPAIFADLELAAARAVREEARRLDASPGMDAAVGEGGTVAAKA